MPRVVDHVQRRTTLAASAVEVIASVGIDALRLKDVAEQAGCTTGSVNYYFENKDDVLLGALEHLRERILQRRRPSGDPSSEGLAVFAQWLPVDEEARKEWRVWIEFLGAASRVPRLAAVHAEYYANYRESVRGVLERAQLRGELAPDLDLDEEAAALIAMIDGIGIWATIQPDSWPEARQREQLERHLDLLRTRPTSPRS